jgi:maltooligosyltrehalose synthase
VLELAATLPVYRTYVTPSGGEPGPQGADAPGPLAADAEDFALVDDALARALKRGAAEEDALRLAASVLVGDTPDPAAPRPRACAAPPRSSRCASSRRAGPATAKGVEDTALYRWSPARVALRGGRGAGPCVRQRRSRTCTRRTRSGWRARRAPS